MNKKVTRRAVLGTTIAALTAGPFVIRTFRNPHKLDSEYDRLVKLARSLEKETGLSSSEILQAVDWLSEERDRWISLREMSAFASLRVTVRVEKVGEMTLELNEPMTWRLVGASRDGRKPFSYVRDGKYPFTHAIESNKQPVWKMEIDGEDYQYAKMTNCNDDVQRCVPVICSILRTPVEYFWGYARTNSRGVLEHDVPYTDKDVSSFVFRSKKGNELFIKNGRYSGSIYYNGSPGGESGKNVVQVEKYEEIDGWAFPSVFSGLYAFYDGKSTNCTLRLTDISLKTVVG